MTTVAVIIPYFQKKTGILRRALDAILQQRLSPSVRVDIIVVDDGSPIAAETEIEGLDFTPSIRLNLIIQPNAGVAAARNAGLQNVGAETTYVAFLDSDDIWDPMHLSTALSALDQNCDYYFCDHKRIGHHDSYLATIDFLSFSLIADKCPIGKNIYEINKEAFFDFFLQTFVSQISTVVYRWSSAPDTIFSFRTAGEDHIFLLQLVLKAQRVCYSPERLVTCGEGVNIYASAYSWDDPGHLIRYMSDILKLYELRKRFPISKKNGQYIANTIKLYRKSFAYLTARYFMKKRELWPRELVEMVHDDHTFWLWYPLYVLYVTVCYPLHLYTPKD